MSEWKTVQVNEVSDIIMGQSPSSISCNEEGIGYPFLQGCAEFGKRFPVIKFHCTEPKKIAPENAILISVRAPVGTTNRANVKVCIGRGLAGIYGSSVDQDLLHYKIIQHTPDLERVSQGSTFLAINTSDLNTLKIEIPTSLPEQRKIARILSTVDAVIEKTEAAIAKYKAIKAGMMHDLFTRGIDLKTGNLRPRYEDAPELYKESELGWVPREWEVVRIGDIVKDIVDNRGKTPSTTDSGTIPLIETVSITGVESSPDYSKANKFVDIDTFNKWFRNHIEEGDVLISTVGEYAGSSAFLINKKGEIAQNLIGLRFSNEGISKFVYYWTKLHVFTLQVFQVIMVAAQPSIKVPHLLKFKIGLPKDKKECQIIAQRIDALSQVIQQEKDILVKHQQLKSALMADLLTGKVRVKYNENEKVEAV